MLSLASQTKENAEEEKNEEILGKV